ncbi:hypothetical protein SA0515718_00743 [Staphylococcus aureus]|nr:hypothetical protein SA0515718_00743 [Staphylococcus aureus]
MKLSYCCLFGSGTEMIFSQNLFRRPTQLALSVEIGSPISLCWGPSPTCIACRISFRNSLCWAPTIFEKSVLHGHCFTVNYC